MKKVKNIFIPVVPAGQNFKERINKKILSRYPEVDLSKDKVVVSAKLI